MSSPVIVIHGGAGPIKRTRFPPERQQAYREALAAAVMAGWKVLATGGSAKQACVDAVKSLEDCWYFNSAKGSVFTRGGQVLSKWWLILSRMKWRLV